MDDERQTERLYRKIDSFFKWTGLYRAVKGTPSLLVTILTSVVVMECLLIPAPTQYRALTQPGLLILGTVIGIISVSSGNYWDRKVFDPRYGFKGTWLEGCPWALFPSGSDLKHYRDRAAEKLKPSGAIDPETGERVYRASESIVRRYPARWNRVEEPNLLSKFARNFILPFFAATFFFAAASIWRLVDGNHGAALRNIPAAAVCFVMAIFLFIPYFSFRIEHMIRLYSEVLDCKLPTSMVNEASPNSRRAPS